MKTLGILGGLGPLAGAHFYRRLVELTPARQDEGHLPVLLISTPSVPSRLRHLRGEGPSPVPALCSNAMKLVDAGAQILAIPSSTTHYYYQDIARAVRVPVLNLMEEVTQTIFRRQIRRVGILATTPTIEYRLYDRFFEEKGIVPVYPDVSSQGEVMDVIGEVKAKGVHPALAQRLLNIGQRPWAQTVDGLVLACTEIPVIFPHREWRFRDLCPLFDATDILALAALRDCKGTE